jgi:DNA (cytosine-5)-methyltransferase 1
MLPTPTAHDGSSNGISATSRQGGPSLLDQLRLLPTPTASDAKNCTHRTQTGGPSLPDQVRLLPTPTAADSRSAAIQTVRHPGRPTPTGCVTLTDSVRLLPTPRATDTGTAGRRAGKGFRPPLSQQVLPLVDPQTPPPTPPSTPLLPTPRATDGTKGCPAQRGSKGDLMLPSAVIRLLTPPANTQTDDTGADGTS